MSKITLSPVGSLISAVTAETTINNNSSVIQSAMDNTLSRDGTSPNTMNAPLDMNSNQIINLPTPSTVNSPLRLQDLNSFIGGGTVTNIPVGGTTGQVLGKTSNVNYQIGWENSVSSVGLALPSDLTVTNSPVTSSGTLTGNWTLTPTGTGSMVKSNGPVLINPNLGTPSAVVLTNATGTASSLTAGHVTTNANLTGPITSVGNATSVAAQTGTGSIFVMNTSPTLVTPALGVPSSGTLTNTTGLPISTGVSGLATGMATFLATPSSSNLKATVTDETGSGALVFATSPTLVTPILGTPTSGTLTSCSGLPLTTGITGTLAVANGGTGDTGTSWTVYTPSITSQGGTPTTVSATGRYKQIGKTVFCQILIGITSIGTATGQIFASLPTNAAAFSYTGVTYEQATTGNTGASVIIGANNATRLQTAQYNGATWWVNGYSPAITITYETP